MAIETGSIRFGVAIQAAAGTLAANPTYLFGVESGDIPPSPQWDDAPLTSGSATLSGRELRRIDNTFQFETRAYTGSIGTLLRAVLGDVDTTGTSTYTHIFTHARPLPYLSTFKEHSAGGVVHALRDGKIKSLRLEWEENAPLRVIIDGVGTVFSKPSSITAGTDETGVLTFLKPVGGTFQYDVDSATPVTASVKGGFIEITNDAEADFYSGNMQAGDTSDNAHKVSCGFTVKPADFTEWNAMVDPALAGTDAYGSIDLTFVNGSASLKLEADKIGFVPYAIPAAAAGTQLTTELGGVCYTPTGWAGPLKATLINTVASY